MALDQGRYRDAFTSCFDCRRTDRNWTAHSVAFAKEGGRVVVSGRHDEEGNKLVAEMRKLGSEAEFIRADVRHEEDVRTLIDKIVERFGRLDVAVNNTGTEGTPGPVTKQTAESYAATFDTNVLGTLLSIKHELRVMLAQGSGSIVNVSSTYGRTGAAGASIYAASKHAVEGLTKSAALEVAGTGVRVNIVAPGPIETPMLNRFTGTDERKAGLGFEGAAETRRSTRRDCSDHRLYSLRQGVIHYGRLLHRRRRQNGAITLIRRTSIRERRIEMNQTIEEKNKELVLRAFDTLFNKRDYVAAERYWSPNYIQHSAHIAPGREGLFDLVRHAPATMKYENGSILAEGNLLMLHGRFSNIGQPVNWIVVDIVRLQDGLLAEHWDVIQDEATRESSKSGAPMFGNTFPK